MTDEHSIQPAPNNPPASINPAVVYVSGLKSHHTRRNVTRHLNQIADLLSGGTQDALSLDWGALRFQHTSAIRARLMGAYRSGTVNVMLSALRGVIKTAWRLGLMTAEDMTRACDVKNLAGESLPAGRDIKPEEFNSLAFACWCDGSTAGIRDSAMIGLLYTCGLRRDELVHIEYEHVNLETGEIKIISGKGNKDRIVYAAPGALEALRDWMAIRGDQPGALFLPVQMNGRLVKRGMGKRLRGMTSQAVYNMIVKRCAETGIDNLSPHDFRRTFVGDMLDAGVDIVTVQKIAGHASVETTGRYDRRPDAVKRAAASKLHYPYRKPNNE